MLYMHISSSDLSSAALKPKYLEDKTKKIEIREALNIPKHSKKIAKSRKWILDLNNSKMRSYHTFSRNKLQGSL